MTLIIIFFFVVGFLMAFWFLIDDFMAAHDFRKRSSRPLIDYKPKKQSKSKRRK